MNITKEQLLDGISHGTVKFIVDPNMGNGTVCQIGENWFYFGGLTAEEEAPEEYLRNSDQDENIRLILDVLDGFSKDCEELRDEYLYYEAILSEMEHSLGILATDLLGHAITYHPFSFRAYRGDEELELAEIRKDVASGNLSAYRKSLEEDISVNLNEEIVSSARKLIEKIDRWMASCLQYTPIQ